MTDLISTGELAQMQSVLDRSLPGTATILRPTSVSDGQGGGSVTWSAQGTVACRLSPRSMRNAGGEATIADRTASVRECVGTFPANTDLRTIDRVTVASETFEVTALHAPRSFELAVRADLVEIV